MSDEENNAHDDSDRSADHDSHERSQHESGDQQDQHDEHAAQHDRDHSEDHDDERSEHGSSDQTEHRDSDASDDHQDSDGHHDSNGHDSNGHDSNGHHESDDHGADDHGAHDMPTVSVSDLDDDARMLDVRERHEWEAGHAPGARLSPLKDLGTSLGNIDINENIPVICGSGGRSSQAVEFLRKEGYDAVNVEGGMKAWAEADKPMVSETDEDPRVV